MPDTPNEHSSPESTQRKFILAVRKLVQVKKDRADWKELAQELTTENIQLRRKVDRLAQANDENARLQKENEQLRADLQRLHKQSKAERPRKARQMIAAVLKADAEGKAWETKSGLAAWLGKQFDVTPATVKNWLDEAGVWAYSGRRGYTGRTVDQIVSRCQSYFMSRVVQK